MTSAIDLFQIGVGPSSSHTVGPMLAALRFVNEVVGATRPDVTGVEVQLYGSLALTGHGTARAAPCSGGWRA